MYSRDQASQLRQAFWTTFGQYLAPITSAEGMKVNWVNYKTGVKHLYFRMRADAKSASIGIEMTHPDIDIQALYFEQFEEFKNILHQYLEEEWDWMLHSAGENGVIVSKIEKTLPAVNIYNQDDWPLLISFFKPRIIALDNFWTDAKYTFESLK